VNWEDLAGSGYGLVQAFTWTDGVKILMKDSS
jgi:hypothetical protein